MLDILLMSSIAHVVIKDDSPPSGSLKFRIFSYFTKLTNGTFRFRKQNKSQIGYIKINLPYIYCHHRQVASVVSDSVRPHGLQPTRLLRPWDSPGKNTGVGCHFLLPFKCIIYTNLFLYTMFFLSIHSLMDTKIVSIFFLLLRIMNEHGNNSIS